MDGLLTEKEQMEALRGWWQENGRWIVAGIVLGVALLAGWKYWQAAERQSAAEASTLYESLLEDVAAGDLKAAEPKAAELYTSYDATVYAGQARLAMARLYMSSGRDQDAADALAGLLKKGPDELRMVGRLRLAKILLYQEKPEEVVDLLEGLGPSSFAARYAEALGDAYAQLGRYDEARSAYRAALAENPQVPTVDRPLIQMKINDLPAAVPASAGASGGSAGEGQADDSAGGEGT